MPTATDRDGAPALTAAQSRIVNAAVDLFARNGVGGTSLQMIADEVGVTKAAVYHQYPTKDGIVLAVAEAELSRLVTVIDIAEAEPSAARARDALLEGMVDLAVTHRHSMGSILSDPAIAGFFASRDDFRAVMHRLNPLLGVDASPEGRVQTAMLVAAISGAVMHPFVIDLDDDVLRTQLLDMAHRLMRTP
jgi:AcrR family transcriptional regulator